MLQNCIAIILAGGKSERMGQPKGLLTYNGHFWLLEHLKRLKDAGINDVIIGLGFDAYIYYKAIPELKNALVNDIIFKGVQIKVVENKNPELGSFSTLQNTLRALKKNCDVLICPIDVPALKASELKKLINTKAQIVKPVFKGESGHPIKINTKFVGHILNQPTSSRLDTVILKASEKDLIKVICNDKQLVMNLNTPAEWLTYKERG